MSIEINATGLGRLAGATKPHRYLPPAKTIVLALVAYAVAAYVFIGMAAFPDWYYDILSHGGLNYLIYQAKTNYIFLNLFFLVGVALFALIAFFALRKTEIYVFFYRLIRSPLLYVSLILLFSVALSRVYIASTRANQGVVKALEAFIAERQMQDVLVTESLEIVYVHGKKLMSLYKQTLGDYVLSDKIVKRTSANSMQAGMGSDEIANLKVGASDGVEKTDKYTRNNEEVGTVVKKYINALWKENDLTIVEPIKTDNKELNSFLNAVEVLEKYDVSVFEDDIERATIFIEKKSINQIVNAKYSQNAYILIDDELEASVVDQHVNVDYSVVNNDMYTVNFRSSVPLSGIDPVDAKLISESGRIRLKLFGRLITSNKDANMTNYHILCLALFR